MDHKGDEHGDQGSISEVGISFFDNGHQTELAAQAPGECIELAEAVPCRLLPFFVAHLRPAQHLCVDVPVAAVTAGLHADTMREGDALGFFDITIYLPWNLYKSALLNIDALNFNTVKRKARRV